MPLSDAQKEGCRNYEMRDLSKRESLVSQRDRLKSSAPEMERSALGKTSSGFELHPSVKKVLEIEKDENARIDKKVAERLAVERAQAVEEGKKAGYAEGFEAGRAEGFVSFRDETSESVERIENLAKSFEGQRQEIFKANEQFIIEMINQVAKKTILRELKTDKEYIGRVTTQIIERFASRDNIRVWLNAGDLECVEALRESLKAQFGEMRNLQISAHPEVSAGGCIVETDYSIIDATIENQLKIIEETLAGKASDGA